ncbi:hypothetical protein [Pseudobythopirellula maris]|nr:hypothetical protein [Pseudobythopirellula maris]
MRIETAAHPGEAVPVVDEKGQASFFLVPEARLSHLEAVAGEESEATLGRLRSLVAEGDAADDLEADRVHADLLKRAQQIDARSA